MKFKIIEIWLNLVENLNNVLNSFVSHENRFLYAKNKLDKVKKEQEVLDKEIQKLLNKKNEQ